jgi:hypothetical protein
LEGEGAQATSNQQVGGHGDAHDHMPAGQAATAGPGPGPVVGGVSAMEDVVVQSSSAAAGMAAAATAGVAAPSAAAAADAAGLASMDMGVPAAGAGEAGDGGGEGGAIGMDGHPGQEAGAAAAGAGRSEVAVREAVGAVAPTGLPGTMLLPTQHGQACDAAASGSAHLEWNLHKQCMDRDGEGNGGGSQDPAAAARRVQVSQEGPGLRVGPGFQARVPVSRKVLPSDEDPEAMQELAKAGMPGKCE